MQRARTVDRSQRDGRHYVEVEAVVGEVVVRGACHGQHMALARRHSAKGAANLGLYSAVRQAAVTAQEQEWLDQPGLKHVAAQASVQIHRTWASVVVAAGLNP